MKKKLYIKTTKDKYELIVEMADSMKELSEKLRCSYNTVWCGFHRTQKGWYVVEIDED